MDKKRIFNKQTGKIVLLLALILVMALVVALALGQILNRRSSTVITENSQEDSGLDAVIPESEYFESEGVEAIVIDTEYSELYSVELEASEFGETESENSEPDDGMETENGESGSTESALIESESDSGESLSESSSQSSNTGSGGTAEEQAQAILASMTLEEQIYQMFIVAPEQLTGVSVQTQAGSTTQAELEKYPVGGIVFFAANLQTRSQVSTMIGILRDDLGFDGLIITDSMQMEAITDRYTSGEAAVKAIQAGVDIILMPADLQAAVSGVEAAVNAGTISRARIEESVLKILEVKIEAGIE